MPIFAGTGYVHRNEFEELVLGNVDSLPSTAVQGQICWNTADHKIYIYDGTNWAPILTMYSDAIFNSLTVIGEVDLGRHVYIRDELITLNYGETGAGISQWGTTHAGIEVDRGSLPTVSLFYDEVTDRWSLTNDGTHIYQIMYEDSSGNIELHRHVYIDDEMITLNYGESGSGISQWGTTEAGIEVERGSLPTVSLFYDEVTDRWSLTNDGSLTEIIMSFDPVTGTGVANNYFLRRDGGNTPTNDISWANHKITNLAEPTALTDAANKMTAIKMAIVLG